MQPQTQKDLFRTPISPTPKQVEDVAIIQGMTKADAEQMYDHYQMQGWYRANGQPICDLVSAVKMWRLNRTKFESPEERAKRIFLGSER